MFSFQAARNLLPGRAEDAIHTLDEAIQEGDQAIVEGRNAIQGLRADRALESNLEHLLAAAEKEFARSSTAEGEPPAFHVTVEGARQPLVAAPSGRGLPDCARDPAQRLSPRARKPHRG